MSNAIIKVEGEIVREVPNQKDKDFWPVICDVVDKKGISNYKMFVNGELVNTKTVPNDFSRVKEVYITQNYDGLRIVDKCCGKVFKKAGEAEIHSKNKHSVNLKDAILNGLFVVERPRNSEEIEEHSEHSH